MVGTNFITDWVIAGAREDERFELTAVCSRTRERGEEFAAKHGIPHVFTSLDAMAASDEVDASTSPRPTPPTPTTPYSA